MLCGTNGGDTRAMKEPVPDAARRGDCAAGRDRPKFPRIGVEVADPGKSRMISQNSQTDHE